MSREITSSFVGETIISAHISDCETKVVLEFERGKIKINGEGKADETSFECGGGFSWIDQHDDIRYLVGSVFLGIEEKKVSIDPISESHKIPKGGSTHLDAFQRNYFYDILTSKGVTTIRFYCEDGHFYAGRVNISSKLY